MKMKKQFLLMLSLMTLGIGSVVKILPAVAEPRWVTARNGYVPSGAVVGGNDVNGETLYVCSIGGAVGKLAPSHRSCYVAYGSDSFAYQKYQVLVADRADSWQWIPLTGDIPRGAVIGGQDGGPLYVCSARYGGKWVPGKYPPSHNVCYIAFGNRSIAISDFNVLVFEQKE